MALPYVARIDNNRLKKAMRFYHRFLDQMRATVPNPELDKAALETALALVRSASSDQWKQVAREMTKENEATARKHGSAHWSVENPPSGQTFELIVSIFEQAIRTADERKRDWTDDGAIVTELFRQRGTGSVGAQVVLEEEG